MTELDPAVVDWLLSADPAVRWQVQRDLLGAPESEWRATRALVETRGWGAELLSHQDADGQWAGGAFVPAGFDWADMASGQPWTATCFVLAQLRELGLDPGSDRARRTVARLRTTCRWEHDGQPFWDGEVEECVNARLVADGAWFGVDVSPVVELLLSQRQPDGGWNCDRERGSTVSSFATTINVVEGLLAWQRMVGPTPELTVARASGEEWLLARRLLRRLSTGEPADPDFVLLTHPCRWRYDVLRALDHFRAAGARDDRLGEAVDLVRSLRRDDGRWAVHRTLPGPQWVAVDPPEGEPSPWVTLHALRVLRWWDGVSPGSARA